MTTLREAAQQALELRRLADKFSEGWHDGIKIDATDIMLLAEVAAALEQPEQEPVAEWLTGCPGCGMDGGCDCDEGTYNPPRREWRGLSKDESLKLWGMRSDGPSNTEITSYARAIEAALKERNHD